MRPLLPVTALLTGCLSDPIEPPWHAQHLQVPAVDVAYDDDGTLHLIVQDQSSGVLHVGTLDHGDRDRNYVDEGRIVFDGGDRSELDHNGIELAIRPGTSERWLFHRGQIFRLDGTTAVLEADLVVEGTHNADIGAMGFVDADTIIAGMRTRETASFALSGSSIEAESGTPLTVSTDETSYPMPGICAFDRADGIVFVNFCAGGGAALDPTTWRSIPTGQPQEEYEDSSGVGDDVGIATTDGFALMGSGEAMVDVCVGKLHADDNRVVSAKTRFGDDGRCNGSAGWVPYADAADLRPDAKAFTLMYGANAIVVFDEAAPKDRDGSPEGDWCPLVGGGANSRLTLVKGEPPVYFYGSEWANYADHAWSASGGKIKMRHGGSIQGEGDLVLEHWFTRVGDTLLIKSGTNTGMLQHMNDSGFSNFSGLWKLCAF